MTHFHLTVTDDGACYHSTQLRISRARRAGLFVSGEFFTQQMPEPRRVCSRQPNLDTRIPVHR
jgi:hypothetical protein